MSSGFEVGGRHEARGGALAAIGEDMALGPVGDEIEPGRRFGIGDHARGVDPFAPHEIADLVAEDVVAQPRDIGAAAAQPCGGNRHVQRVAAEARQEAPVGLAVQFIERLAERDDVEAGHAAHAALCSAPGPGMAPGGHLPAMIMPSTSSWSTSVGARGAHDAAVLHHRHAVGEVEHVVDVVADEEDADAFGLELLDELAHLCGLLRARAPPSARP